MNSEAAQYLHSFLRSSVGSRTGPRRLGFSMVYKSNRFLIRSDCKISFRKRGKGTDQVLLQGRALCRTAWVSTTHATFRTRSIWYARIPWFHWDGCSNEPNPRANHLKNGSSVDRSQLSIYSQVLIASKIEDFWTTRHLSAERILH
jgi:hypothetical protein